MNKFDEYIQNNRDDFDYLQPSEHTWRNIEKNIKIERKLNNKQIIAKTIISVAAVIAIAIILPFLILQNRSLPKYKQELAETSAFYNCKIELAKENILKLTNYNSEIRHDIELEFKILDKTLLELQNDLNDDISNKIVSDAIIEVYRMKLEIIDQMLFYIEAQFNYEQNIEIQI